MIKVLGISICTLICSIMLKNYSKPFSILLSLAGSILMFFAVSNELGDLISYLSDMTSYVTITQPYIKLMLKVLGITLVAQFVCDVCRDNGENALASITSLVAKVLVVSMILPLFETVISIITGLIK